MTHDARSVASGETVEAPAVQALSGVGVMDHDADIETPTARANLGNGGILPYVLRSLH